MPGHSRMRRAAEAAGAGAALAAVVAAAANPKARDAAARAVRFARPLDRPDTGPITAPPLPPARIVPLPGRGEAFTRDSGGPAPTVLLLHGWGATADANFFNAYGALTPAYRVLAPDHRAHGRGPRLATATLEDCADDAAELLAALDAGPAIAVGYSMGGPVALLLAQRHPAAVAGLVLEATALDFSGGIGERLVWQGLRLGESAIRHIDGDGIVDRLLRDAIDQAPAAATYRAWLAGELRRGHREGIIETGRSVARFDAHALASGLRCPAAVVATMHDRLVPTAKQLAMAAALGAPVFELDADHDAPITHGDDFAAVTRAAVDHVARRAGIVAVRRQAAEAAAPGSSTG